MNSRVLIMLMLAPGLAASPGCDAIVPTHQCVQVRLTDLATGAAVGAAQIVVTDALDVGAGKSPDEYLDRWAQAGQNLAFTDEAGQAQIPVNTTIVRGGLFDWRNPLKDRVAGRLYYVRVCSNGESKVAQLLMQPGAGVRIDGKSLAIESIGEPKRSVGP